MKGILVTVELDGTIKETPYDHSPCLEDLQSAVGGFIEKIYARYNGKWYIAYVNEDAKLRGIPVNTLACKKFVPSIKIAKNKYTPVIIAGPMAIWVKEI